MQVRLTPPRLAPEFRGYRVVHLSDIHRYPYGCLMDAWMSRERLLGIVRLINAQAPDTIALTGDFLTHGNDNRPFLWPLVEALRSLRVRDAVVGVCGDHDRWTAAIVMRYMFRVCDVVDVNNGVRAVSRGGAKLHFAGVDDYRYFVDSGAMARIGDNEAGLVAVRTWGLRRPLSPPSASSSEVHKVPLDAEPEER